MKREVGFSGYVLMTAARNEITYVPRLLESVVGQTVLPVRWVIVDDGSADGTDEFLREHTRHHEFITVVRREGDGRRSFASKASGLRVAYDILKDDEFAFVGNLDADISLPPDYYERVLDKFEQDEFLGIGGGFVWEVVGGRCIPHTKNLNSVPGAVQLFRRECYEELGGYPALEKGGIDTLAEVAARMKGWRVRSFRDIVAFHHRETGRVGQGALASAWREGVRDYALGYHPLFYFLMCVTRVGERPYGVRALGRWMAYVWQYCKKAPVEVPPDIVSFLRTEQLSRIKQALRPGTFRQAWGRNPTWQ